jgi:hypothetical protein
MQDFGGKNLAERDHLEDLYVDGRILKLLVKKFDGISLNGVTWLRTGIRGGNL